MQRGLNLARRLLSAPRRLLSAPRRLPDPVARSLRSTAGPHRTHRDECSAYKLQGRIPSTYDKKVLLWTGRFKREQDIPEIVSPFQPPGGLGWCPNEYGDIFPVQADLIVNNAIEFVRERNDCIEMLYAARNKIRVQVCYLMIAMSIVACVVMVVSGKKAFKQHESLTKWNLEKKAKLKEQYVQEHGIVTEKAQ